MKTVRAVAPIQRWRASRDARSIGFTTRSWLQSSSVLLAIIVACNDGSGPSATVDLVEVTPSAATRQVGETVQLNVAVKDASGNILSGHTVSWSSSDATVASVSASGLVTANALGVASVSAAAGGKSGGAVITVAGPTVASVTVAPTTDTLLVGETVQLTATVLDADGNPVTDRAVTWISAMPTVASVSSGGLVTGVADGVVAISATLDGKTGQATIEVWGPCSTALTPSIDVGDTVQGDLASTDCPLDDGSYADGYALTVDAQTDVQIDMTSTEFDTWLWLLELLPNGDLEVVALNDDVSEGNTDAQILFTLAAGIEYFILANSFDPDTFGEYELKVVAVAPNLSRLSRGVVKRTRVPPSTALKVIRPR